MVNQTLGKPQAHPGRPRLYDEGRLSDRVVLHLTAGQRRELEEQARHTGRSLCAFIRASLFSAGPLSSR